MCLFGCRTNVRANALRIGVGGINNSAYLAHELHFFVLRERSLTKRNKGALNKKVARAALGGNAYAYKNACLCQKRGKFAPFAGAAKKKYVLLCAHVACSRACTLFVPLVFFLVSARSNHFPLN